MNITLVPSDPTVVVVNSDIVLNWNYSLGSALFREVSFTRIRSLGDQTIGLIIRGSTASDKIIILDQWAKDTGRFEIRTPATLIIRNVTADDTSLYQVEVQSLEGVTFRKDRTVIYLDVLGKLSVFIYYISFLCSVFCLEGMYVAQLVLCWFGPKRSGN